MPSEPRFATPRNLSRKSHGKRIAAISKSLGKPFLPWQRAAMDLATETMPDGTFAYSTIVVTVPRQAGKSTMVFPLSAERCLSKPNCLTWYSAQSRADARDHFNEIRSVIKNSPLQPPATKVRLSNGNEAVEFQTGSAWRIFAPSDDALHGRANELVALDEIWAHLGDKGLALEQAIVPTFLTTGGQLLLMSTAGTADSVWLKSYVDLGRHAVKSGQTDGIAYIEYSLDPKLVDEVADGLAAEHDSPEWLAAIEHIYDAHPAKGYTLSKRALISAAKTMQPGEALRALGNVWTATAERVIPADAVADTTTTKWPKPTVRVALAFDVDIARKSAAIAAAWRDRPDGILRFDIVAERPGTNWLPAELHRLEEKLNPCAISWPGAGPAAAEADEAKRLGVLLTPPSGLTTKDYTTACPSFLSALCDRRAQHLGQASFVAACASATKRPVGQSWAWKQSGPVSAATVAAWIWDHQVHVPAPIVRSKVSARGK